MSRFGVNECERARMLAALAPDGELSELERRGLRSHLRGCGSCARFALGVDRLTGVLRADELQYPSLPAAVPSVVRRRGTLVARVRPVAAAAAVALMALGVASRAPLEMDGRDSGVRTTAQPLASEGEANALRVWRHITLPHSTQPPLDRDASVGRNQPV